LSIYYVVILIRSYCAIVSCAHFFHFFLTSGGGVSSVNRFVSAGYHGEWLQQLGLAGVDEGGFDGLVAV
jgi:hypothetical protein